MEQCGLCVRGLSCIESVSQNLARGMQYRQVLARYAGFGFLPI